MARSRSAQNGCRRPVGWMPPARRRHAELALSGHRPYGTSAQIVRTESRRLIITGQRISAPRECSRLASMLGVGRLGPRREPVFGDTDSVRYLHKPDTPRPLLSLFGRGRPDPTSDRR
jgi:hypothetical protein